MPCSSKLVRFDPERWYAVIRTRRFQQRGAAEERRAAGGRGAAPARRGGRAPAGERRASGASRGRAAQASGASVCSGRAARASGASVFSGRAARVSRGPGVHPSCRSPKSRRRGYGGGEILACADASVLSGRCEDGSSLMARGLPRWMRGGGNDAAAHGRGSTRAASSGVATSRRCPVNVQRRERQRASRQEDFVQSTARVWPSDLAHASQPSAAAL